MISVRKLSLYNKTCASLQGKNRTIWGAMCLLFCLAVHSPKVFAEQTLKHPSTQVASTVQQEKAKFLYGFYTAYMSSIIYNVEGLKETLKAKYLNRKLLTKFTYADILLDAQDCIEENLKTLSVIPIDDVWYKVSFFWPSPYPTVPTRQHIILVKVVRGKKNYKISDIKVEQ